MASGRPGLNPTHGGWPTFLREGERDVYFGKAICQGYRIRKIEIGIDPVVFSVTDIDERRGAVAVD